MSSIPPVPSENRQASGLLDLHVVSFVDCLRAAGYAESSVVKRQSVAKAFVRWMRDEQVALADLDESHVAAFFTRTPERTKDQMALERAALRLFLRHLRDEGEVPPPPKRDDSSPVAAIKTQYVDFLRNERGLTEQSINVYSPFIQEFLTEWADGAGSGSAGVWNAQFVDDFLLHHVRDRSSEYTRLLATTLRSFLRFLYLRGETATDLSPSVPRVRRWREATVPAFLSSEEVERTLSTIDLSTACGRRDHAIVLLLARLGLRAGEVVALELGDIRWRTAQLCVRGKGRVLDQLPLLSEVGEALAVYLRRDRGESASRRVFLRIIAPRVGLSGPGVVSHIVRRAFAQAGIQPTSRGAAHLFRHSLATRMLRQGASMADISELLRHRSQATTSIYAKVDFEALRGVAGSWPGTGGAQ
jgi:integrase/recombinase XerD